MKHADGGTHGALQGHSKGDRLTNRGFGYIYHHRLLTCETTQLHLIATLLHLSVIATLCSTNREGSHTIILLISERRLSKGTLLILASQSIVFI